MAKEAVEQIFNGSFTQGTAYDATRITIPPTPSLIRQWDLGPNPQDKFVGPLPIAIARPNEQSTAIPPGYVHVIQWSSTQWWVFYSDNAAAAATRRVGLYFYNPETTALTWQGFITLTYPATTAHTIRGFRMARTTYSVGTASASGTAVTGVSTVWAGSRLAVGSRIGFGSTNPTAITTWFQISAIGSDTSITLTASAGTVGSGPYVIEELRAVTATTNATATNGGLNVAKGLRIENFIPAGTTIPAATTVDNIRAVYWLRDAATITNTTACGISLDDLSSQTLHDVYITNGGGGTACIIYRYNTRAALTLTAGAANLTAGVDMTITGTQTVTGNLSQNGNGRLDTLSHGPGSGVKSLYLVTASRIIRIAIANVTTGNTTFVSDQMTENPPGTTNTYPAFATFSNVEIAGSIDRLVVSNGAAVRHYITRYRTDSGQMDHIFLVDDRQTDQSTIDSGAVVHPTGAGATSVYFWAEGGVLFQVRQGTTNATAQIYAYPIGVDWTYVSLTNQRVILPQINLGATPSKFYRVLLTADRHLGSDQFGKVPEPFRVYYRTSGISDNSGGWTLITDPSMNLSGVSATSSIQFALEFKMIGDLCIPARVLSLAFLYETTDDLPSQYQWNYNDSNATSGIFAWTQRQLFGSSPTLHTIEIFRADTNALVLTQASSGSANGTFEFWNGSAWAAGLGTDTLNLRRRFVPTASLPSGVDLYARITVA